MSICNFLLKIVGDCYPLPGEDVHNINHELAWICEIEEWVHLFYLFVYLLIYLFYSYCAYYFQLHIENNLVVGEEKVFEHGNFDKQLSTTVRQDIRLIRKSWFPGHTNINKLLLSQW
jgi:hypothetical protein